MNGNLDKKLVFCHNEGCCYMTTYKGKPCCSIFPPNQRLSCADFEGGSALELKRPCNVIGCKHYSRNSFNNCNVYTEVRYCKDFIKNQKVKKTYYEYMIIVKFTEGNAWARSLITLDFELNSIDNINRLDKQLLTEDKFKDYRLKGATPVVTDFKLLRTYEKEVAENDKVF